MNPGVRPAPAARALSDEDQGRHGWYLLLARMFRGPPDAHTLAAIASCAPESPPRADDAPLVRALAGLAAASAHADPALVRQEYDAVFIGVGKAEIFLNASWHLNGALHDRLLVELREQLAQLGLARRADVAETEDHFAALCETMALLIAAAGEPAASLRTERQFFQRFLAPWFESLCEAIEHSGNTDFYKHAARAAGAFLAIERQAFDFE